MRIITFIRQIYLRIQTVLDDARHAGLVWLLGVWLGVNAGIVVYTRWPKSLNADPGELVSVAVSENVSISNRLQAWYVGLLAGALVCVLVWYLYSFVVRRIGFRMRVLLLCAVSIAIFVELYFVWRFLT